MKIRINETNEEKSLSIIDPRNNCDWIADLMGNHDELPEYDDEIDAYWMDKKDFEWWKNLVNKYQAADDRFYELYKSLDSDVAEKFLNEYHEISVSDLENYPNELNAICDRWDN